MLNKWTFQEGDRFYEAANINRDWPENRAIFLNHQNTLCIWVNEMDHLLIRVERNYQDIHEREKKFNIVTTFD